ncbi:hypothetical protein D3C78_139570 [compost metagenome]
MPNHYGDQVTGALASMFGTMLGESSSTYRALYAAQQSFALAQAGMNVWKSASDAFANEPGTVWQKIGASAMATLKSGTFVKLIQAATPKGFANGGLILGPGTGTSDSIPIMASDKEFMIRAASVKSIGTENLDYINKYGELPQNTKRVGVGTLNAINSGKSSGEKSTVVQPVVNIHTLPGETADVSMNSDGSLDVRIRKIAGEYLNGQLSNPNSQTSKTMKQNFNVTQKR